MNLSDVDRLLRSLRQDIDLAEQIRRDPEALDQVTAGPDREDPQGSGLFSGQDPIGDLVDRSVPPTGDHQMRSVGPCSDLGCLADSGGSHPFEGTERLTESRLETRPEPARPSSTRRRIQNNQRSWHRNSTRPLTSTDGSTFLN